MTPEEANATVEAALAKGMAKYSAPNPDHLTTEERNHDEYENLANIYMAELTDWTVQMAFLVGDKRWEMAADRLPAMRMAVDKLAGAVSELLASNPTP